MVLSGTGSGALRSTNGVPVHNEVLVKDETSVTLKVLCYPAQCQVRCEAHRVLQCIARCSFRMIMSVGCGWALKFSQGKTVGAGTDNEGMRQVDVNILMSSGPGQCHDNVMEGSAAQQLFAKGSELRNVLFHEP